MKWAAPIIEWQQTLYYRLTGNHVYRERAAQMRLHRTTGLWISEHCLDRYCERWRPYAARDEARATLTEMLCAAEPVGHDVNWCRNDEVYTPSDPWMAGPIRLIVRAKTVVTILPLEPL